MKLIDFFLVLAIFHPATALPDLYQRKPNPQAILEITLMIHGAVNLGGTITVLIKSIQKNLIVNSMVMQQTLGRRGGITRVCPLTTLLTNIG